MLKGIRLSAWFMFEGNRTAQPIDERSDQQRFWDELVGLAPEDRERRIEKRRQYERFAEQLGLVEVEAQTQSLRNQW